MHQITTAVEVDDFLRGTNFMSASGGGDPVVERGQLLVDLQRELTLGWTELSAFEDDDLLFCVCYSGAIAPEVFEDQAERAAALGGSRVHDHPFTAAVGLLEHHLGRKCDGLISVEIGGINSGAILSAAARLGLPLADADYAGRAIPELHSTALQIADAPVLPFACADHFGNETLIVSGASNAWTERISKHLAQASLGLVACAFAALPASRVREIAVQGTMSESLLLGKTIREAQGDPVAAAAEVLDGSVLFRGVVSERSWENTGYMDGRHVITGEGEFANKSLEVWFRNENHLTWLDGEPWVASPDLIEFCDATTAEPLVNTHLTVGQKLAVVGRRRRDAFDSPGGLAALGPAHFGFDDFPFRGIEELVKA